MVFFLAASFLIALLFALILTPLVRKLAVERGWNGPSSAHHVHDGPVPRVGGIAVFCAVALAVPLTALTGAVNSDQWIQAAAICLAGSLVFLVGLYDDFRPVRPWVKLIAEASAAVVLFTAGIRLNHLPLIHEPLAPPLALILTIVCVIGITNAFNLIDGLDGLAAGIGIISAASFLILALHRGSIVSAWVAVLLVGATSGFLRFNLNPARIFLGDCGSLFIGFLISALAITVVREATHVQMMAVPVLAVGLPVLDTLVTIVRRYAKGRPIFVPDREHIHHKLLERGHSHRSAVLILYAVSVLFGFLGLALMQWRALFPILALLCGATSMVIVYLGYHRSLDRQVGEDALPLNPAPLRRILFQSGSTRLRRSTTFPELWRTLDRILSVDGCLGYDLSIPIPVAGMDLRRWGFLLDDGGASYIHSSHGTGHLNGSRPVIVEVNLEMRKQPPHAILAIYLRQPMGTVEEGIPAAFPSVLSETVVRALNTARKEYRAEIRAFDSGVLAALRADHTSASNSAD